MVEKVTSCLFLLIAAGALIQPVLCQVSVTPSKAIIENGSAQVVCHVELVGVRDVKWFKNGEPLDNFSQDLFTVEKLDEGLRRLTLFNLSSKTSVGCRALFSDGRSLNSTNDSILLPPDTLTTTDVVTIVTTVFVTVYTIIVTTLSSPATSTPTAATTTPIWPIIIGIVVAVLGVFCLVAGLLFYLYIWQKKRNNQSSQESNRDGYSIEESRPDRLVSDAHNSVGGIQAAGTFTDYQIQLTEIKRHQQEKKGVRSPFPGPVEEDEREHFVSQLLRDAQDSVADQRPEHDSTNAISFQIRHY